MALFQAVRVQVASTTSGLSDFGLGAAPNASFQDFTDVPNGSEVDYVAFTATEFEAGTGTYNSGTSVLTRDTIDDSSNAGAKVNFGSSPTIAITFLPKRLMDINGLTQHPAATGNGTSPDWDVDRFPLYDVSAGGNRWVPLKDMGIRDKFPHYPNGNDGSNARAMYLRTAPIAGTISNATPAVASFTGHDYLANDPVVFSAPWDMKIFTVTIASPGVFTAASAHDLVAGDRVKLFTSGALPTGLSSDTTYFVIAAGLTSTQFQLSTTSGGAAINTSGTQSGEHIYRRDSVLPTGVTEGKIYYVSATGLVAGTSFQFSATPGGASINTSSAQVGKVWAQTGNDNNDGMSSGRSGAMLTFQNLYQRRICDQIDGTNMDIRVHVGGPSNLGGTFDADEWQTGMATEGGDILIDAADAAVVGTRVVYWLGPSGGSRNLRVEDAQHLVYWELKSLPGEMRFFDMYVSTDNAVVAGLNPGKVILNSVDVHRHGASTAPYFLMEHVAGYLGIGGTYAIWGGNAESLVASTNQCMVEHFAVLKTYVPVAFSEGTVASKWTTGIEVIGGQATFYNVANAFTNAGRITGKRFNLTKGAIVNTFNQGLSYLPGDADGIGKDGAIYDNTIFINGAILSGDINIGATDTTFKRLSAGIAGLEDKAIVVEPASSAQGDILYRSSTANVWSRLAAGTSGQFLKTQGAAADPVWDGLTNPRIAPIGVTFDGGGSAVAANTKRWIWVPYACTINDVTITSDVSCTAVVDIWVDTYANYPPTVADTITASAKPTITAAIKNQDTTLTGWTTSIAAGRFVMFNVDSNNNATVLQVVLKVTKT